MLKILLDEQISSRVGEGLRRVGDNAEVHWMSEWDGGRFLGQDDLLILREAANQGLTLVTYDRKTIPPILKTLAEQNREHGGVVFVDEKTIYPAEISSLIRALRQLWEATGQWEWTNRVYFLRR